MEARLLKEYTLDITKDVCWIGDTGFDGGGSASLGIYFHKIFKMPLYFKGTNQLIDTVTMYNTYDELYSLLKEQRPKVIILFPDISSKVISTKHYKLGNVVNTIKSEFESKLVLIDCTRKGNNLKDQTVEGIQKLGDCFDIDEIWSINEINRERYKDICKDYKCLDINLYCSENIQLTDRERTIGYPTRFVAMKGVLRLLNSMQRQSTKIPYVYLGNDHTVKALKEKGTVGGPMQVVQMFSNYPENKIPKDCFSMKCSVDEPIVEDKINIYPRYNVDDKLKVFSKIGIAVCPSLAKEYSENNKKDNSYIEKNKKYWYHAMEYVNYELIDYGIPVMFSRDYCNTYDKTMIDEFPELVYDNLEDCLQYVQKNYDKLQESAYKQKAWLEQKLDTLKSIIESELERLSE